MKRISSIMMALLLVVSASPVNAMQKEEPVRTHDESVSKEEPVEISGTSAGNEIAVSDGFMNVWLYGASNGHYEYRGYRDGNDLETLEIRFVPDEGYEVKRLNAENFDGDLIENENGVLTLTGALGERAQYWVYGAADQASYKVNVTAPEEIRYEIRVNRQKSSDHAYEGQMVTVTAMPEEDGMYAGMSGYKTTTGENLFDTDELFYTFVMPADDVNVVIRDHIDETLYMVNTSTLTAGTATVKTDGTEINRVRAGKTVTIEAKAEEGYAILGLHAIDEYGNSVFFGEKGYGTFVMPESNVRIEADFAATDCENGSYLTADLLEEDGERFYAIAVCADKGYLPKEAVVRYTDGTEETVAPYVEGYNQFRVVPKDSGSVISFSFKDNPGEMRYIDENGHEYFAPMGWKYIEDGIEYNSDKSKGYLGEGWFVVKGNVDIINIEIYADTNIILCDGAKLEMKEGLCMDIGCTLNVWAQSNDGKAGIIKCLNNFENTPVHISANAVMNIHSGELLADGKKITTWDWGWGQQTAGIRVNGRLNVYGGKINALGAGMESGICVSGQLWIYGGEVTARTGNALGAAAIGAGCHEDWVGLIAILGGTVKAYAVGDDFLGGNGAGIGGSEKSEFHYGEIRIEGGDVYAESGNGAGIGAGEDGTFDKITITGGRVHAKGYQAIGLGDGCRKSAVNEIIIGDHMMVEGNPRIDPYSKIKNGEVILVSDEFQ